MYRYAILLLGLILSSFYSCDKADPNATACDVDYDLINRYVNDLNLLMNKESEGLYAEAFSAYRRLEVITKSTYNTDSLYYMYTTGINNRNKMSDVVDYYITWLAVNKCSYTIQDASRAFDEANSKHEWPDYTSATYIERLRMKNGLSKNDMSKDRDLITADSSRFESLHLSWVTDTIYPPKI